MSVARRLSDHVIRDVKSKPEDIEDVVMVGGLTRMPAVQELVKKITGGIGSAQGEIELYEVVGIIVQHFKQV